MTPGHIIQVMSYGLFAQNCAPALPCFLRTCLKAPEFKSITKIIASFLVMLEDS